MRATCTINVYYRSPGMADTRYLKRRRQTWYFHLAVPADLRAKLNKTHITETLRTRDLTKAQRARWEKVAQWSDAFEKARGSVPLTNAEIEAQAQRVFSEFLSHLNQTYEDNPRDVDAECEELSLQADLFADAAKDLPSVINPTVAHEVVKIETRTGATLERGSETYNRLVKAISQALLHATLGRRAALQGEAYDTPPTFGGLPRIDPLTLRPMKLARLRRRGAGEGVRFSEASERFLAELQRDKGARKTLQTIAQHEAVFRLFTQFTSDASLEDVTEEKAAEFIEEVSHLHPHWGRSPETKKLSVWELLERFGKKDERLSNRTLNRYLSSLRAVYKWARKRGVYKGPNPFAEQSFEKPAAKETMWKLYTPDELQKLLHAPLLIVPSSERVRPKLHDVRSALRWLPLMALFTGARQGELCQLHKSDIISEGGVTFIRIHAERDGQRLKTEAAERNVPIHSELIRCGFLDYLRALPNGQLFPGLKPGGPDMKLNAYFTKRFTAYRRSVGVVRPRVVFHSLRKNAAQALKNARTSANEIAEVIGHERGFTVETYAPLGLPIAVLKELVERIAYPGLDLTHLYVAEITAAAAE